MFKKTLLPLLGGVVLASMLLSPITAHADHCLSYCRDYAGWAYAGCTIYMDENDDIVDVECDYTPYKLNIADDAA